MKKTEFFEAIKAGNTSLVFKALKAGMNPDVVDNEGKTARDLAIFYGQTRILELLSLFSENDVQEKDSEIALEEKNPVCVVGYSGIFPGSGNSPDGFWQTLFSNEHKMTEAPAERWDTDTYYSADRKAAGKMYTQRGGFIESSPYKFDADFFTIMPKEAEFMDPQQRLTLEAVWYALEHAGIDPNTLKEKSVGVYCGVMTRDYTDMLIQSDVEHNNFIGTGNCISVLAGRVSYVFGLQGPSMTIGTACSSSLVTAHLAMRSLQNGDCDIALAGGVNLMLAPGVTINCCKANMLAEDGVCKTFSELADGYGRGEGVGMLVLKRYRDAIRDGNTIHGIIKGSAVNQDGQSNGLTVPNKMAQVNVIEKALATAELSINDIDFIEAHGTGTQLGDAIEIDALKQVFAKRMTGKPPVLVNSTKSYVGHLEAAAGVAGIVRVLESFKHETLTAKPIQGNINPRFKLEGTPVSILQQSKAWPVSEDKSRRAGVSSFGFSGTNAHVILEEPPRKQRTLQQKLIAQWANETAYPVPTRSSTDDTSQLLLLSAKTEKALDAMIASYISFLSGLDSGNQELWKDIAFSSQTGRAHHRHRLCVQANSIQDALEKLQAWSSEEKPDYSSNDMEIFIPNLEEVHIECIQQRYQNDVLFAAICDDILRQLDDDDAEIIAHCLKKRMNQTNIWQEEATKLLGMYALSQRYQRIGMPETSISSQGTGHFLAAVLDGRLSFFDMLELFKVKKQKDDDALENVLASVIVLDSDDYWSVETDDLSQDLYHDRLEIPEPSSRLKLRLTFDGWLNGLTLLYLSGRELDWIGVWQGSIRQFQQLPLYPFQGQIHRFQANSLVRVAEVKEVQEKIKADAYVLEWAPVKPSLNPILSDKTTLLILTKMQSSNSKFVGKMKTSIGTKTLILAEGPRQENENGYTLSFDDATDWKWFHGLVAKRDVYRIIDLRHLDLTTQKTELLEAKDNLDIYFSNRLYQTQMMFASWPADNIPGGYIACFPEEKDVPEHLHLCHEGLKGQLRSVVVGQVGMMAASMQIKDLDDLLSHLACLQMEDVEIRYVDGGWLAKKLVPASKHFMTEMKAPLQTGIVITGGLGGLGFLLAKWFAQNGSAHIALLGRRHPDETQGQVIDELQRKHRVKIHTFQTDVSNEAALSDTITQINQIFKIDAVYHLAGKASNERFEKIQQDDYQKSLSAKVIGALNLKQALSHLPYWPAKVVLFSSVASLLPEKGQTTYNIANRMLDALAQISTIDKPITVINWGLWSGAGIGQDPNFVKLIRKGSGVIDETESRLWLDKILASAYPQVAVLAINWSIYQRHLNKLEQFFAKSVLSMPLENSSQTAEELLSLSQSDRTDQIRQLVIGVVANYSGKNPADLNGSCLFEEHLGLDSNTMNQIKDELQDSLGSEADPLPATLLNEHESIEDLTQFLSQYLDKQKTLVSQANTPTDYIRELVHDAEAKVKLKVLQSGQQGGEPPLILIHTIMGTVFFYRALVDNLQYDGAIYGIDDPYFANLAKKFDSVEEMAHAYALVIKAKYNDKPIRLAGLSFAGAVAYEVAQQLSDMGGTVDNVLMFDTAMPGAGKLMLPDEHREYVMGEIASDINTYYQAEINNNQRILNAYQPEKPKLGMRVILLKARSPDSVNAVLPSLNDVCNHWLNLFCPEVYSVFGSHFSMFDRVYVNTTVQVMRYAYGLRDYFIDHELSSSAAINRRKLLLQAAKNGDTYIAVRLIKQGEDPLLIDDQGLNAVSYAVLNDDLYLLAQIHFKLKHKLNLATLFPLAKSKNALKAISYLAQHSNDHDPVEPDDTLMMDINKKLAVILFGEKAYRQKEWMEILESHNQSAQASQNRGAMQVLSLPTTRVLAEETGSNLMSRNKTSEVDDFRCEVVSLLSQHHADKPNLFLFHPASGLSISYARLGNLDHVNVFAFNNPYFGNQERENFRSIEEMATHYLLRMKQIQAKGPYYLGGWSLGGICAQAIASILEEQGEIVELVIMIDSINHFGKPYNPESEKQAIDNILATNPSLENKKAIKDAIRNCYLNTSEILHAYQAKRFSGRTILLKAEEHETNLPGDGFELLEWRKKLLADPFSGWGNLLPNLEIQCIRGGHNQLFDPAFVGEIGKRIEDILKTIESIPSLQVVPLSKRWVMNLVKAIRRDDQRMIKLLMDLGGEDYRYQDKEGNLLDAIIDKSQKEVFQGLDFEKLAFLNTRSGRNALSISLELGLFDEFSKLEKIMPRLPGAQGFFGQGNEEQRSQHRAPR